MLHSVSKKVAKGVWLLEDALPHGLFKKLQQTILRLSSKDVNNVNFWYDYELEAPDNIFHEVIRHLSFIVDPGRNFKGAEWWIRINEASCFKSLHFDQDEYVFNTNKEVRNPAFGSVFYLDTIGGGTVVTDQTYNTKVAAIEPSKIERARIVIPRANRYLVFPGNLRHGVKKGEGNEMRHTFLVNWWNEKPHSFNFREDQSSYISGVLKGSDCSAADFPRTEKAFEFFELNPV